MPALTLEHHPRSTSPEPATPSARSALRVREAHHRLGPLLAQAAALDLDDAPGWARLRATAHATTSLLCGVSSLPWDLHVRHGDPPLVIARKIAAAWRRVDVSA
jgi:hypothetical protein